MPSDAFFDLGAGSGAGSGTGAGADPEQLATFVQEYVRRESQADAGSLAVIASQLRDPRWLPHQIAERLLATPAIQAAIVAVRKVYRPPETKDVSVDTISADMEVLYQEAKDARQFTAAIAAKKLQAEISGFLVKTIDVNVRHSKTTMTDAELEAIIKRATLEGEFTDVTGLPAVVNVSAN